MKIFYAKAWPEAGQPVGIVLVAKSTSAARRLLTPKHLAEHGLKLRNFDGSSVRITGINAKQTAAYILSSRSYT